MATRTLSALFLALLVSACGSDGEPAGPRVGPDADLPDQVVVFGADDGLGEFAPQPDWTPDAEDIEAAEELLAAELAASDEEGLDELTTYVRQYAGIDGDALEVNALCDTDVDWQESWIEVDDGGACYWNATVVDGRVESFQVNGSG